MRQDKTPVRLPNVEVIATFFGYLRACQEAMKEELARSKQCQEYMMVIPPDVLQPGHFTQQVDLEWQMLATEGMKTGRSGYTIKAQIDGHYVILALQEARKVRGVKVASAVAQRLETLSA